MQALLFVCLIVYIQSAPMTKNEAMSYLEKYGYMTKHDDADFAPALELFQNFMGLPMTGEMNEDTDKMMNMPRCGMKDMNSKSKFRKRMKRYKLHGSRWRRKTMTYQIVKYSDQLQRSVIDRELQEAFDIWSKYINLTFSAKTTGKADLDIGFYKYDHGDSKPFEGSGHVLAHAYYPIFGGDIHFDESEEWTSGENTGINFKWVAVHEIGHTLGLEHSENNTAIMFPTYTGYVGDILLSKDDINGIQWLYTKKV